MCPSFGSLVEVRTKLFVFNHRHKATSGSVKMVHALRNDQGLTSQVVKPALELFTVRRSKRVNYSIQRKTVNVPRWRELCSLPSTSHAGVDYAVGDFVYILLQGNKEDAIAKIRDIKDLNDGRRVICVSWCCSEDEAREWRCSNMTEWPTGYSHMLSTHLQVLMWDTANGRVGEDERGCIVDGKILDLGGRTAKIYDNGEIAGWMPILA